VLSGAVAIIALLALVIQPSAVSPGYISGDCTHAEVTLPDGGFNHSVVLVVVDGTTYHERGWSKQFIVEFSPPLEPGEHAIVAVPINGPAVAGGLIVCKAVEP